MIERKKTFWCLSTIVGFICLFSSGSLYAQDEAIVDSLKKILLNKKLSDTTILRIRTDIGQLEGIFRVGYWDSLAKDCDVLIKKKPEQKTLVKSQVYQAGAINNIGYIYNNSGDRDKAVAMYLESLAMYNKISLNNDTILRKRLLIDKAQTINNLATMFVETGDVVKGKEYHLKSLALRKQINDKEGIALSYNNLGYVAGSQGNIQEAVSYYFESLKIREEIKDWKGLGQIYGNIAALYNDHYSTEKAIEFHRKALTCWIKAKERSGIAHSLNNIGTCYLALNKPDSALVNYEKALAIRTEIGYKKGIGNSYYNLGIVYTKQNKLNEAQAYFEKSLTILTEVKDKVGIIQTLQRISELNTLKGNTKEALKAADRSFEMASEMGFVEPMQRSAKLLYMIYSKNNEPRKALQMYELHIRLRDSISNVQNKKQAISKEFEYEYEKKAAADSVRMLKEKEIKNAQIAVQEQQLKQEATQRYALYGGLALTVVFGGFIFNRFKITQKQKKVIELKEIETQQQKHLIEEKHKEITDSINYAERIQRSFLASEELLNDNLSNTNPNSIDKNYFVFFQPKDVVSGDFYWAAKLSNGNFALATADSTGHGVPGAIMSILNISCLEKSVEEHKLTEPNEILNHTRTKIIERLKKDGSKEGGKDGMDCSLISFDFKNSKLTYAAANNPVWIVRSVSSGEGKNTLELIELKPDKMPVGKHDKDSITFTQHSIAIQKGDVVYALTDGMPDQFGGPKGKKFMYKQLKELLIEISHFPMQEQQELLKTTLNNWKGNIEQVDDVCVIGIRV